MRKVTV